MRKPDFCICENKDADQLRGNRAADQRLSSLQCYSVLSYIWVKNNLCISRWNWNQVFYLLVMLLFAYLLPVSLNSPCFSVLSTKG